MKKILTTALAIGIAFSLSNAYAGIITFDFTNDGYGTQYAPKSFLSEDGSISVLGDAQARSGNSFGTTRLSWGGSGLYINNHGNDNTHEIDGSGWDERVLFEFANDVTITSISFTNRYADGNDDFSLWVGEAWSNANYIGTTSVPTSYPNTYTFSGTYTNKFFAIGALGNNDNFKIDALTVSYAPVPEPTTMLLFGTGLIGLVGAARRRRK